MKPDQIHGENSIYTIEGLFQKGLLHADRNVQFMNI
jgi:hypothetical protein